MKKFLRGLATAALFGLAMSPFAPATAAQAGHFHTQLPQGAQSITTACDSLKAWYVNGDETGRKPTSTPAGLEFKANQLVHHETNIPLKNLTDGSFSLAAGSDAPDQPSFFSVEVRNTNGAYGTLRWNTTGTYDGKWSITIGAGTGPDGPATAGTFAHDDPMTLLTGKVTKWGAFDPATAKVVSFGVGYTNSPPGTKTVVVKRVNFKGQYDLTCPPVQPSASASASNSPTPSPSMGQSGSAGGVFYETCADAPHKLIKGIDAGYRPELDSDGDGVACEERGDKPSGLPLTGTKPLYLAGVAGVILVLGGGLAIWGRRRKVRFGVDE